MTDYIAIAELNDFIFCPYSIYLHNVYEDTEEDFYKATPQAVGKIAHSGVDNKTGSTRKSDIYSLPIISEQLGLFGKIDLYRQDKQMLIERKYQLKQIFRGQIYQLWAQCFCLKEMGYDVRRIAFYEISTNKMIPIEMPTENDKIELRNFIWRFRHYNPLTTEIPVNPNKCAHCIYCNLCDKTNLPNVYT